MPEQNRANMVRMKVPVMAKAVESAGKPTVAFTFSTDSVDRHGETIAQDFELTNFKSNPVFLNSHRYGDATEVIGKVTRIQKVRSADGERHEGTVEFAVDANPKARIIYDLYVGGFLSAVSIGGIPLELDPKGNVLKLEMLEISAVSVPANAEALAKQKGIDVDALGKSAPEPEGEGSGVCCCDCLKELTVEQECLRVTDDDDVMEVVCAECAAKSPAPAVKKDVDEACILAEVIGQLNWLIKSFARNEVSEKVTDKMVDALKLLLEAMKMEATLGKKSFRAAEIIAKARGQSDVSDAARKSLVEQAEMLEAVAGEMLELAGVAGSGEEEDVGNEKPEAAPAPKTKAQTKTDQLKRINEAIKNLGEGMRSKHAVGEDPRDVRAENTKLVNRALRGLLKVKGK